MLRDLSDFTISLISSTGYFLSFSCSHSIFSRLNAGSRIDIYICLKKSLIIKSRLE